MKNVVLVIEDHAALREVLSDVLEMHGYRVLGASNGNAGLDLAREEHPDIVISDYYMPEADGLDVLRGLRTNPDTAETPFIMMSMEAESWLREEAFRDGANDFLQKPFDVQEMIAKIEDHLNALAAA